MYVCYIGVHVVYTVYRGCHICGSTTHKRRDCHRKNVIQDYSHKSNIKYVCV